MRLPRFLRAKASIESDEMVEEISLEIIRARATLADPLAEEKDKQEAREYLDSLGVGIETTLKKVAPHDGKHVKNDGF